MKELKTIKNAELEENRNYLNRDSLIDALRSNKWTMDQEYDFDEDKEINIDCRWHILTDDGYRAFHFGDKNQDDFKYIRVIDFINRPDKEWSEGFKSFENAHFQIDIQYVHQIRIEDSKIYLTLNLPGKMKNEIVFY